MKKGFTLAEVLITLGIIGIVAAMTMPAIIENHKKKEYSVRLKRFYSIMQQAVQLSTVSNEDAKYWKYPNNNLDELDTFWNTYFKPYFKSVIKTEKCPSSSSRNAFKVYFQDGSAASFTRGGAIDFTYDVNADKSPNIYGKDKFLFLLNVDSGKFTPYGWQGDIEANNESLSPDVPFTTNMTDRDNVVNLCKHTAIFCSQLLSIDNWEFKEDYPYKL